MSYEELKMRPNYWTLQKQMQKHAETEAQCFAGDI